MNGHRPLACARTKHNVVVQFRNTAPRMGSGSHAAFITRVDLPTTPGWPNRLRLAMSPPDSSDRCPVRVPMLGTRLSSPYSRFNRTCRVSGARSPRVLMRDASCAPFPLPLRLGRLPRLPCPLCVARSYVAILSGSCQAVRDTCSGVLLCSSVLRVRAVEMVRRPYALKP